MNWQIIARKLTSRKLWMALAGLVSGYLINRGADPEGIQAIIGLALSAVSVVAYIIGESWVDAKGTQTGSAVGVLGPLATLMGSMLDKGSDEVQENKGVDKST